MQTMVLFLIPPLKSILGNPHIRKDGRDSYRARYPAIGIAYIIALLKQARFPCKVLDMNLVSCHSCNVV
jgi:hypothetical protein